LKTASVFEVAVHLSRQDLRQLEDGFKVKSHHTLSSFTLLVVLWNSRNDKFFKQSFEKLVRHNISVANISLSRRDIEQLKKGNFVTAEFPTVNVNLMQTPTCPLCGATLKPVSNGIYECPSERIQICVHMLTAKRKDVTSIFSCSDCTTFDIYDCDCMDCYVFCQKCKTVVFISCTKLTEIVDRNRKHKP